jgi:hypothetical protein
MVVKIVARVKDRGLIELGHFKSRVLRQKALNRIKGVDADWLINKVEEVERYIIRMDEAPFKEQEFM